MVSIFRIVLVAASVVNVAACSDATAQRAGQTVPAVPMAGAAVSTAPSPGAHTETTPAAQPSTPRRVVVNGIDLSGIGYDVGNPKAPVVLVNFSDFGCSFCGTFARETYPTLAKEFVQTGKVFFKYVPFVMGMFPNAPEATRAAECAAEQGKFWPMHDRLYATQRTWKRSRASHALFQQEAMALDLDPARFSACYIGLRTDTRTGAASSRAKRLGIRTTPSFFINGQLVEGALPLDQFWLLLTEAAR